MQKGYTGFDPFLGRSQYRQSLIWRAMCSAACHKSEWAYALARLTHLYIGEVEHNYPPLVDNLQYRYR